MKDKILKIIRDILEKDNRVVFAYVYGSFVKEESFRDIDIGVYVRDANENPYVISSEITTELSSISKREGLNYTADDFDVRIINDAPFTFLNRVFREGILLKDNDPELRTDIIEYVSRKYRECAGLLAESSFL